MGIWIPSFWLNKVSENSFQRKYNTTAQQNIPWTKQILSEVQYSTYCKIIQENDFRFYIALSIL